MTVAIIVAGGRGVRLNETVRLNKTMGGNLPKQHIVINGKTILEHSVLRFAENTNIDGVIIVCDEIGFTNSKILAVVKGGETRTASVYVGLLACPVGTARVLIHDAVRPCISQRIIDDSIKALIVHKAVNTAIKATDTVFDSSDNETISSILNRQNLYYSQTPQSFHYDIIMEAHERYRADNHSFATDDCGLVVHYGLCDVHIIKGDPKNIKVTFENDLEIAKLYLR
jgi:2-C-methyl-D-erythritol 4-phosphate cytidylyltransferase